MFGLVGVAALVDPYKADNAAGPAGVPDMSINEGRHRWEKLVVVPLKMTVSSRARSTSRLVYSCCSWTKWTKGRSEVHYIRFFAQAATNSDYRSEKVRLENEMKGSMINY